MRLTHRPLVLTVGVEPRPRAASLAPALDGAARWERSASRAEILLRPGKAPRFHLPERKPPGKGSVRIGEIARRGRNPHCDENGHGGATVWSWSLAPSSALALCPPCRRRHGCPMTQNDRAIEGTTCSRRAATGDRTAGRRAQRVASHAASTGDCQSGLVLRPLRRPAWTAARHTSPASMAPPQHRGVALPVGSPSCGEQ